MREQTAERGETIVQEDDELPCLIVVTEGVLALISGAGIRERLLYEIFPFETFGEVEFLDQGRAIGRVVALSKRCRYVTVSTAALREVVQAEPMTLPALAARCSQHTRFIVKALRSQVADSTLVRVASALVAYAPPSNGLHPALPPLSSMTQTQIAVAAGTVKEVAARAVAELEARRALERSHGHISLLDRGKLLNIISAKG